MKKIICLIFFIFFSMLNLGWTKKPPKCNCPIYFFENIQKEKVFDVLDEFLQNEKIIPKKFYPEQTFISFEYSLKDDKIEIITFDIKQFGNDTFLYIDISEKGSDFEIETYSELKKLKVNSYRLQDDLLCKEFKKDISSINKNRKPSIQENQYNENTYIININRYIGYDKKKYFLEKRKEEKINKKLAEKSREREKINQKRIKKIKKKINSVNKKIQKKLKKQQKQKL